MSARMATVTEIKHATVDELCLDPMNPRLGRGNTGRDVTQAKVMELMKDWTLDELAVSFLQSGFWPQEALVVVREKLYGKMVPVVIEGNRRLAALRYLRDAIEGRPASRKWADIAQAKQPPPRLFEWIPYIEVGSRNEVEAFLGFRHVTGIMEWRPAEKAQFIGRLVEEGFSYEEVMRKIGSKTPTVRQNYIAYRLLLQMEEQEDIAVEKVEDKFSVLYLSLRTEGVQKYLRIDIKANPKRAKQPVPPSRRKAMASFARWLFGDEDREPLFTDSRQVDAFGTILRSAKAVEYLDRTEKPVFEVAFRIAGGDEPETVRLVESAADNVELALSKAHLYTKSADLRRAVERLGADAAQLLRVFPDIEQKLTREAES